jgi:O-antigen/teichoic acid export membrane protein
MSLPQKVLLNTAVQVAGKVALALGSIVVLRLTAGYLGLEGFGALAIVLAFAVLLSVVADLGMSLVLARELAKAPERASELGGTLLALRLLGSLVLFGLFLPVVPFMPYSHEVRTGLVVAAAGVVVTSCAGFPAAFFQVHLRLERLALLDALSAIVSVALAAIVVTLDLGLLALVAVIPAGAVLTGAAAFWLSRDFWTVNLRPNWPLARALVGDLLPIAFVSVVGFLHFRVDSILLSLLRPAEEVGVYTVAYKFLEQSLLLPTLFMGVVFPILTRALHAEDEDATSVIRRSFHFLLLLGVPLAIATVALARPLVHLVAGSGFDAAAAPLRILAPAIVLAFVNVVFAGVLFALNRRRELLWASLAGLAVNIALNLIVIPTYGYNGAAATTVFSEALGLALMFWLARRAHPFTLGFGSGLRAAPQPDARLLADR